MIIIALITAIVGLLFIKSDLRGCQHPSITVTDDGGRCNKCKKDLYFYIEKARWE